MNAPIITSLSSVFGATWADRWDIHGTFTFDAGAVPAADMEIWLRREFVDADFALWGTFHSAAAGFALTHLCVASGDPIHYQVKLRFNNYTEPPGPFSNAVEVVMAEPAGFLLVKETGAGLANANSYASAADGNAYHDGHLYATAWTGATDDQKAAALVMATRLIDAEYQFNGVQTTNEQALSWPRYRCPDPDRAAVARMGRLLMWDNWLPENRVPKNVVAATCELARELLIADRTASPPGEGLKYQNVGGTQTGYDKTDRRAVLSQVAQVMLAKYGSQISAHSGAVRLVRV